MPPRRRTRPVQHTTAADPATRARAGASSLKTPGASRTTAAGRSLMVLLVGRVPRRGRDGESSLATSGASLARSASGARTATGVSWGWRPGRQVRLGRGLDRPGSRIAEEMVPDPGTCSAYLARRGGCSGSAVLWPGGNRLLRTPPRRCELSCPPDGAGPGPGVWYSLRPPQRRQPGAGRRTTATR